MDESKIHRTNEADPSLEQPEEIERKFLVKSLPENLDEFPNKEIIQGYIAITPDTEVRLRKKGKKYFQTVKIGDGKTRIEAETPITKEQFDKLWLTTEGKRVEKTRYEIPHEDGTIELDVYHGDLDGLLSTEMEFASEKDSNDFTPPEWFGKEVTEDKRYKNQSLALHGIPKEKEPRQRKIRETLDIPEYELERGVGVVVDQIKEQMEKDVEPIIVQIAGGSASGKTSKVADEVKRVFGREAMILSMDDYYRGKAYMDEQASVGNELNWDQPEALNLDLLQEHLAALKKGEEIEKPIYSMKESEVTGVDKVKPKKIIIVEGLFALNDIVKDEGRVKAFVDIGTHGRIMRRLLRDVERTGQKPADILKYFSEIVEPMHDKYIESTKGNADLIIKNEYKPEVEAEKSGLHEVQLKFTAEFTPNDLRKLGAERLGTTKQLDKYYNPDDRELMKTGEMVRVRAEGNDRILTYKGPKVEGEDFRKRPKFEFEIDKDTEQQFLSIYGDQLKEIQKDRTFYSLDGVIFTIDKVTKIEDGKKVDLGIFLEVRSTDKEANEARIKEVIAKLGLKMSAGIKESYFEM